MSSNSFDVPAVETPSSIIFSFSLPLHTIDIVVYTEIGAYCTLVLMYIGRNIARLMNFESSILQDFGCRALKSFKTHYL